MKAPLAPLIRSLTAEALARIGAKVDDAAAHARNALTATLRATPDGRATIRRANRNPSFLAALARLDELLTELAGPSASSTEGTLRDGREALYTRAFSGWAPKVPEAIRTAGGPDQLPTAAELRAARTLVLHGYDLRREIGGPIADAKRRLSSAVVLAGSRGADDRSADDLIAAWARATKAKLGQVVSLSIGDAAVALEVQAGRDLVRPEFLDESPLEWHG
jgi:hypothetical protein